VVLNEILDIVEKEIEKGGDKKNEWGTWNNKNHW
jgi:hypothetical protein